MVRLLVNGEAPREVAPFLAGANLTALPKKDMTVRPVAVGETWRRLVAKCLANMSKTLPVLSSSLSKSGSLNRWALKLAYALCANGVNATAESDQLFLSKSTSPMLSTRWTGRPS